MSIQVIGTCPVVNVTVTSSVTKLASENRFQRDLTVGALKGKLELVTGAQSRSMVLQVFNSDDALVCILDDDNRLLGSYPVDSGMRIHVIDKAGRSMELEDVSSVEKFEISEESYAQRKDTVRAFKERMKVGQFKEVSEEEKLQKEAEKEKREREEKEKVESIQIGSRCEVEVLGQPRKRGTVMYAGFTDFKPGYWIGIKYDEPMGKHDGCVEGKRYFECLPKYGAFVKPNQVSVGDYPELDIDDDLEM